MRVLLTVILSLCVAPAFAADWPDLLGTWKGTSRAVVLGEGGHYDGDTSGAKFLEAELTIEWTEQKDGRYIGTISSAKQTEAKLGVLSADGKSLFTVDTDGSSDGRLIDNDHFELCYQQTSASDPLMVASCVIFERQT
jgi:hypothetical protein